MDPSHTRRYRRPEIEIITARFLSKAYPNGIEIPIEIDLLVEKHEFIDDINPIPLLEDKYKIAAVLYYKNNDHFDILVDEDTFNYNEGRTNFSIAHEFAHIILHNEVFLNCENVDDIIDLNKRIATSYRHIENDANYFAGSILIPQRTILGHTATLYEGLAKEYGCDINLIPYKLCSRLAEAYKVSFQAMEIRLKQLKLDIKVLLALRSESPYIDP